MKNRPPALSLKNLTGAFIVLLFGFSLSLLAFLCEQIISVSYRHSRRLEKNKGDKIEQESTVNVEVEVDTESKTIDQKEPSTDTEKEFGNKSDHEMNENEATNAEIIINIKTQSTKSTRENLVVVNCEEVEIFYTELNLIK